MTLQDQIKHQLLEIEAQRPNIVKSRLELGDEVSKNHYRGSFIYTIDDPEIYKDLGEFENDFAFYLALDSQIRQITMADSLKLFPPSKDDEKIPLIPFSTVVKDRVGECLEKSVLVQLAKQDSIQSFVIYGLITHDQMRGNILHAYNILLQSDKPYLLDAQNPMIFKEKTFPFLIPILGIDSNRILIEEKWRAGRSYSIINQNV